MITLNEFVSSAEKANVRLTVNKDGLVALGRVRDEAFFQSPLLSLCITVVSKERNGQLSTSDAPAWVGATLTRHFDNSTAIRRQLEWSLDYRRRCADAIVFLENIGLIIVSGGDPRHITCTPRADRFLREARLYENEIGVLVRALTKAYRIVEYHGLELF